MERTSKIMMGAISALVVVAIVTAAWGLGAFGTTYTLTANGPQSGYTVTYGTEGNVNQRTVYGSWEGTISAGMGQKVVVMAGTLGIPSSMYVTVSKEGVVVASGTNDIMAIASVQT